MSTPYRTSPKTIPNFTRWPRLRRFCDNWFARFMLYRALIGGVWALTIFDDYLILDGMVSNFVRKATRWESVPWPLPDTVSCAGVEGWHRLRLRARLPRWFHHMLPTRIAERAADHRLYRRLIGGEWWLVQRMHWPIFTTWETDPVEPNLTGQAAPDGAFLCRFEYRENPDEVYPC